MDHAAEAGGVAYITSPGGARWKLMNRAAEAGGVAD